MSEKSRLFVDGILNETGTLNAQYNLGSFQDISIRPVFQQWVIVEVILDPIVMDQKKLNQLKQKYGNDTIINLEKYAANRLLPRNTVIAAKVINLKEGVKYEVNKLMLLYPFFPPALSLPCKPGEHVWVMFEHLTNVSDIGYWVCNVVGSGATDDVNHSHYPRIYENSFIESNAADKFSQTDEKGQVKSQEKPKYHFKDQTFFLQDPKIYERTLTRSEASYASVYESVPRFKKRPGDIVFEGSNNALIVLGRDRTGNAVEYTTSIDTSNPENPLINGAKSIINDSKSFFKKRNAGAIDIVTGRGQTQDTSGKKVINDLLNQELAKTVDALIENEGNPDFKNDRSRIYVSQNTKIDETLQIENYNAQLNIEDNSSGDACIVIKSDKTRIFSRSDVQLLVTGFDEEVKNESDSNEPPPGLEFLANEVSQNYTNTIKNQKSDQQNWASITISSDGNITSNPASNKEVRLNGIVRACTDLAIFDGNSGAVSIAGGAIVVQGAQGGIGPAPELDVKPAKTVAYAGETADALKKIADCLTSISTFLAAATPGPLTPAAATAAAGAVSKISANLSTIISDANALASKAKIQ